ncbi:hypothetical protein N7508_004025 [Penicillium antarcticum]|uniref:uncharacterized protein n=1 Tax=Penicillium antarcticum TaxID=416450 RepID=UPI0023855D14|nr:uncharacterized protein N7508_004025 [Penicillium antarcticum]KAJ5308646.1 hypothetical protein N7508_004025 [Penicillium antarcticum]
MQGGAIMNRPGGGGSAVFGSDGRKLTVDYSETEETILCATLDSEDILMSKAFVDVWGHYYSRPDLLWLGTENEVKMHVRSKN